jgi:hypothetical protein
MMQQILSGRKIINTMIFRKDSSTSRAQKVQCNVIMYFNFVNCTRDRFCDVVVRVSGY